MIPRCRSSVIIPSFPHTSLLSLSTAALSDSRLLPSSCAFVLSFFSLVCLVHSAGRNIVWTLSWHCESVGFEQRRGSPTLCSVGGKSEISSLAMCFLPAYSIGQTGSALFICRTEVIYLIVYLFIYCRCPGNSPCWQDSQSNWSGRRSLTRELAGCTKNILQPRSSVHDGHPYL
jgi:hypothetical protein